MKKSRVLGYKWAAVVGVWMKSDVGHISHRHRTHIEHSSCGQFSLVTNFVSFSSPAIERE